MSPWVVTVRCLLHVLFAGALVAQDTARFDTLSLSFRHISIKDGLSQGMVNHIVQDRFGFMWFATKDGLNRYDGYHFKVYRHDLNDTSTISDNYANFLFEDSKGRLWVGTHAGLDLFDRDSETFIHFRNDNRVSAEDGNDEGLNGRVITGITEDRNGDLWVSTKVGVDRITFPADGIARPDRVIITHVLSSKKLWRVDADTKGGLHGFELGERSVMLRPENGSVHFDTIKVNTSDGHDAGVELMLLEDTLHSRIYKVNGNTIAQFNEQSKELDLLFHDPSMGPIMATPQPMVDERGRIWLAGLAFFWCFDPYDGRMSRVMSKDPNLKDYVDGAKVAYRDRSGLIWVGTSGYGILTYDPRSERFHPHLGRSVSGLEPTADGKVIVDERRFLSIYDPATQRFDLRLEIEEVKRRTGFQGALWEGVNAVQDPSGVFWTSKHQLERYDHDRGELRQFDWVEENGHQRPFPSFCFPLFVDSDDLLWFGSGDAFHCIHRRTFRQSHFPYPIPAVDYQYLFLQAIHKDSEGVFWLGTTNGLLRFDPRNQGWQHFANDPEDRNSLSHDVIFSILDDPREPRKYLWLGTNGGGLNRINKTTGHVDRFTTHEGLPNDVVYGILDDEVGDLWLSTNKGISCFTPSTLSFRNYDESDGLQGDEFNRYAYCKMSDGTLYFGGINGFNYFAPSELKDDHRPVQVRITDIKLMNRSIVFDDPDAPLDRPAYLSERMTIPHGANMITFEFAGMDFASPQGRRYQYKMEGFDPEWIMSGTANAAIYTNLDPGTYVFNVKGMNRDGVWNEQGTSFYLTVQPPWWRTWWFYLACVFGMIGSVWLYLRGLRAQRTRLEETVQLRTRELVTAKERAEKSEQIKQQFLANMSHEIRTPMNAVMGMTNILRRKEHPPEQDRYLDAIAVSSENLLVVINDILDLSKIEAGMIILERIPFDPRKLMHDLCEMLQYNAEQKGLGFHFNIGPQVPDRLLGDGTRVQQILLNLVGNGIKFTESGAVKVNMSVVDLHERKCTLRIEVIDTGVGIPADRVHRIFEEFTQAYSDTSRKYGGTGLGLTISRRLVEMQGGSIEAQSEQGKGSTFTVTIPFDLPDPTEERGLPEPVTPGLMDLRILIAEDNEFNALVAQDELADAIPGVQITLVKNGAEAVDAAATSAFDLILMDVQMPVMNGYDATRGIRSLDGRPGSIPIIAMTANVMRSELELCEKAGMNGHIPKPFTRDQLMRAISDALR